MAIVVETGTGLDPTANSYVSRADLIAFALERGITVADVAATDALLIKAKDYLESLRAQYQGTKTAATQPLQWPRTGVNIDNALADLGIDVIPQELKNAQMQLALEVRTVPLMPTQSGKFVVRRKTGPLETEYSAAVGTLGQPYIPSVDAWLSALLGAASGFTLTSYRY